MSCGWTLISPPNTQSPRLCLCQHLFFPTGGPACRQQDKSCLKFFCKLEDELIDNQEDICMMQAEAEEDAGEIDANAAAPTLRRTL